MYTQVYIYVCVCFRFEITGPVLAEASSRRAVKSLSCAKEYWPRRTGAWGFRNQHSLSCSPCLSCLGALPSSLSLILLPSLNAWNYVKKCVFKSAFHISWSPAIYAPLWWLKHKMIVQHRFSVMDCSIRNDNNFF